MLGTKPRVLAVVVGVLVSASCRPRASGPAILGAPELTDAARDAPDADANEADVRTLDDRLVAADDTHFDVATRWFEIEGSLASGDWMLRAPGFPLIASDGARVIVADLDACHGAYASSAGDAGAAVGPSLRTLQVEGETIVATTSLPPLDAPPGGRADVEAEKKRRDEVVAKLKAIEDALAKDGWTSMPSCTRFDEQHTEPYACRLYDFVASPDGDQELLCGAGPNPLQVAYHAGQKLRLQSRAGSQSFVRPTWRLHSSSPKLREVNEGCFIAMAFDPTKRVLVGLLRQDLTEPPSGMPHVLYPRGCEEKWVVVQHALGPVSVEPAWVPAAPTCASGMRAIPEGDVLDRDGGKNAKIHVAPFCIDATEVTVEAYKRCVAAGGCPPFTDDVKSRNETWEGCNWHDAAKSKHPMNCVTRPHAAAYCAWAGKRLPKKPEWDFAAFGSDAREHPWGSDEKSAGVCATPTCPVGTSKEDVSPFGVLDMGANVNEWTLEARPTSPWMQTDVGWSVDERLGFRCAR